jgi:membrane protease YdiL (CAAX protease family)
MGKNKLSFIENIKLAFLVLFLLFSLIIKFAETSNIYTVCYPYIAWFSICMVLFYFGNKNRFQLKDNLFMLIFLFLGGVLINFTIPALFRILLPFDYFWTPRAVGTNIDIDSLYRLILFYLVSLVIGPITEECFFRAILFKYLVNAKFPMSTLLVSLIFAFLHQPARYEGYLGLFIISLIANYLFIRGGVMLCIVFHVGMNVTAFMLEGKLNDVVNTPERVRLAFVLIFLLQGIYLLFAFIKKSPFCIRTYRR